MKRVALVEITEYPYSHSFKYTFNTIEDLTYKINKDLDNFKMEDPDVLVECHDLDEGEVNDLIHYSFRVMTDF